MTSYLNDPANIYFNANFINTTNTNINAEYNSYRNAVIVNSPSEYYLSIENFEISDFLLPIMTVPVTNPSAGSLSLTIDNSAGGGGVSQQYLQFINNSAFPPSGRVYNIEIFVQMMNVALAAAHTASGALGNAPVFYYNDPGGYFSFLIDQVYVTNGVEIYFNNALATKFSSFLLFFNSYTATFGREFRLTFYPSPSNQLTQFPPPATSSSNPITYPIYKIDQPYNSLYQLSDVIRLVVTTTQMPTLREYITGLPGNNINVTLGILFSVPINHTATFKSEKISYRPANNRFIDLISQEPLNIIDYQIYYQTTDGRLHPVRLAPGQSFGITFRFLHRSLVDNAYTFNKLGL